MAEDAQLHCDFPVGNCVQAEAIAAPLRAEIERLRAVALAARALVQTAQSLHGALNHSQQIVSERTLTELESALEAAGYGMTEEEFEATENHDG